MQQVLNDFWGVYSLKVNLLLEQLSLNENANGSQFQVR